VALAALAARQHGVVSLAELRALGLTAEAVRSRVASGKLHRVHRGVYSVGHPILSAKGHAKAATLACGVRCAASHHTAAAIAEIGSWSRVPHVTVARGTGGPRRDIRVHTSNTLLQRDVVVFESIPCTSVARTILDLADHLSVRRLERVVDQAEVLRLFDMRAMDDVLARAVGRRGMSKVRAVLAIEDEPAFTKSDMEEMFLAMCAEHGLPRPLNNHRVEGEQVDFHWPDRGVVVETDSKTWHGTTRRREKDIARDRKLQLAGWRVLRFSWRAIEREPAAVAKEIRAFLTAPAALRIAS
jgi:very-short-patch-repair endonuclease